MRDFWNLLTQVAGVGALFLIAAAGYYLYKTLRARKDSRSALFGAERQSAADRAIRAFLSTMTLLGLALLAFGVALLGETRSPLSVTQTAIPVPTVTTSGMLAPTAPPLTTMPDQPPVSGQPTGPSATVVAIPSDTPMPATPTTEGGESRRTAVVSGAGEALLKLRREPMTNADIIAQYPDGTVLEVLEEQQTNQGLVWQKVRDAQGNEGWVANLYLVYNP